MSGPLQGSQLERIFLNSIVVPLFLIANCYHFTPLQHLLSEEQGSARKGKYHSCGFCFTSQPGRGQGRFLFLPALCYRRR